MIEIIIIASLVLLAVVCSIAWYRIVDPSEAHLVVTPRGKFVVSPDEKVGTERTYFSIPSWIPFVGRAIRVMDVTIKELLIEQETIEKNQARYSVKSSTKYRVNKVKVAAETFLNDRALQEQLKEIVRSGVRAITVQYEVTEARANKRDIEEKIREEIVDDLEKWGLELINFQLVEFRDTADSNIISNISRRSEVEIEARTREQNAEKLKQAKIKEAEADEKSQQREIERDRVVGEQKEKRTQKIAEAQKVAEEKRYEVVQVQTIKQAEIDKEKAIILANQNKETEAIMKEQKLLEGQGNRAKAEEMAKGEAAPILEKGLAEAKAKDALQKALNQFGDEAIRALVAEKVVAKDEAVGVAMAQALEKSDMKVYAGGGDSAGFDFGKIMASMSVADSTSADAIYNKLARPNDLGMTALALESVKNKAKAKKDIKVIATKKTEDQKHERG